MKVEERNSRINDESKNLKINDEKEAKPTEKISGKPSMKKKKVKETIIEDDQNDSLINELADFLNGTSDAKQEETEHEQRQSLNQAILNEFHEIVVVPQTQLVNANASRKSPQSFREITEKQILSQNNEINNQNEKKDNENEEEQGPPVNFEYLQQVNDKRPQTSYGGLSARQKSLHNSLRQKSSKIDNKKGNNDNPFGMKNRLSEMKHFFNN